MSLCPVENLPIPLPHTPILEFHVWVAGRTRSDTDSLTGHMLSSAEICPLTHKQGAWQLLTGEFCAIWHTKHYITSWAFTVHDLLGHRTLALLSSSISSVWPGIWNVEHFWDSALSTSAGIRNEGGYGLINQKLCFWAGVQVIYHMPCMQAARI